MVEVASQVDISKASKLQGWMTEGELTWLATKALQCKTIVEFGSFKGRSTRALADNTDGTVYAVDPWNGDYPSRVGAPVIDINTYVLPEFKQNLRDHIDSGRVIPVRAFSRGFKLDFPVDMVFIDGDHNYDAVKDDIIHAFSMVRPGGIISGHDYNNEGWPDVNIAVHEILGNNIEHEEMIWWKIKS